MQLGLVVWFVVARRNVRKLKREEKTFLRNLSLHGIKKSNFRYEKNNSLPKEQYPSKV